MSNEIKSTISNNSIPYKLPSNWKWYYWEDLITGYQQGLIRSNNQLGNGNVYYLKMGDLDNNGGYSLENITTTVAKSTEIDNFRLYEKDFLINVRNTFELVGKTCFINNLENKTVLFNHMLVRISHKDCIPSIYINAFLNIPSSKKLIDRCKKGTTTVIALYQKDLFKLPLAIPDNLTLKYISKLYGNLNAKIELNNRINRELEQMAKLLYDYWFVQFDFPNANGKPYKSSGGKMIWNMELKREIPEGWEVEKIRNVLKTSLGGTPSTEIRKYWEGGDFPWLNSGEIANFPIINSELKITKEAIKNSATALMPKGTVALSITRHIRPTIFAIDACANQSVVGIYESELLKSSYIFPLIKNEIPRFLTLRTGAQQPHINKQTIDETNLIVPNQKILKKYYKLLNPIYDKIINNAFENHHLTTLRDWLLPMLMNGQVRVGETDKKEYQPNEAELDLAAEPGREMD